MPSARLWLGNISNQATAASVRAAFEGFGPVIDAAAFPARIGPLGYAIVVFERVRQFRTDWHSFTLAQTLSVQVELPLVHSADVKVCCVTFFDCSSGVHLWTCAVLLELEQSETFFPGRSRTQCGL